MKIPGWWKFITLIAVTCFYDNAASRTLVEQYQRMEIDWGRLRIRFWGVAEEQNSEASDYGVLVEKALIDGIGAIKEIVTTYHKEHLLKDQVEETIANHSAMLAGDLVAKTTYAYHTEYYSEGGVKIYLENLLARALSRGDLLLKSGSDTDVGEAKFSGLVLRSDNYIKPRASYRIADETGKLLYSIKDVYKGSYQKNLMGRWLVDPTRDELVRVVGSQPLSIQFTEGKNGDFIVPGKAWDQFVAENKPILSQAKIALVVGDNTQLP